jgi:inosine-uridine nucleoside N-ribohydrolase
MQNVVLFTDIGGDVDDTLALYTIVGTCSISVLGIVMTGNDNLFRAHITRKILSAMGLNIPVITPKDKVGMQPTHEFSMPKEFVTAEYGEYDDVTQFLTVVVEHNWKNVSFAAIGPLTPIADAMLANPSFIPGVKRFYIQGQAFVRKENNKTTLFPDVDGCYNLREDKDASKIVFEKFQNENVPITLLGKHAAYRVLLEKELFRQWSTHFNLLEYALMGLDKFWRIAPEMVYKIYCVPESHRTADKYVEALKYLSSPYDPLLVLTICDIEIFEPVYVDDHVIIGGDADHHGVPEPEKVIQVLTERINKATLLK